MSAWIEIFHHFPQRQGFRVALYVSAWIEMPLFVSLPCPAKVALYVSAWIEITVGMKPNVLA
ncbi:hypothetical protein DA802_20390 [Shouchella clausii]|nr:hypothetical protein DA802_20390 [Shouchella clausii]